MKIVILAGNDEQLKFLKALQFWKLFVWSVEIGEVHKILRNDFQVFENL